MKEPGQPAPAPLSATRRRGLRLPTLTLWLASALLAFTSSAATTAEDKPIRLGFSINLFSGINEADARAAVRTLTTTISKNKNIPANPEPFISTTIDQAETALLDGTIDVFGMTTEEYRVLAEKVPFDQHLFTAVEGKSEEVFLLIVSKLSTLHTLENLHGRNLLVHAGPRTQLALPWLDLKLAGEGQPDTRRFFASIEENTKAAKFVLPVFFRKADACLITQRSYQTVTEMNPQVASELQVIAQSVPYIPLVIAFRSALPPTLKERVYQEFLKLHTSAYGQQGLMIFQTQRFVEQPLSILTPTLEMLETHARVCPRASAVRQLFLHQPREPLTPQP